MKVSNKFHFRVKGRGKGKLRLNPYKLHKRSHHKLPKNIHYRSFLFGDFDGDGIKNIDDRLPFKKGENDRINPELKLSRELLDLEQLNRNANEVFESFKRRVNIEGGRVKHPISIIRKLRLKYVKDLTDLIGTTILVDTIKDIKPVVESLRRKFKIVEDKDYYASPRPPDKVYRGRHLIVMFKRHPIEVQIKTRRRSDFDKKLHYAYKQGKNLKRYKSISDTLFREGY